MVTVLKKMVFFFFLVVTRIDESLIIITEKQNVFLIYWVKKNELNYIVGVYNRFVFRVVHYKLLLLIFYFFPFIFH